MSQSLQYHSPLPSSGTLRHCPSVIIIEDEVMIAFAMEEEFTEARFNVAGIFSSCAETFEWLKSHQPDVAVLDALLQDGRSDELALELKRRGVPFLICSGMPRDGREPPELADVPRLNKPAPFEQIVRATRSLLTAQIA